MHENFLSIFNQKLGDKKQQLRKSEEKKCRCHHERYGSYELKFRIFCFSIDIDLWQNKNGDEQSLNCISSPNGLRRTNFFHQVLSSCIHRGEAKHGANHQ